MTWNISVHGLLRHLPPLLCRHMRLYLWVGESGCTHARVFLYVFLYHHVWPCTSAGVCMCLRIQAYLVYQLAREYRPVVLQQFMRVAFKKRRGMQSLRTPRAGAERHPLLPQQWAPGEMWRVAATVFLYTMLINTQVWKICHKIGSFFHIIPQLCESTVPCPHKKRATTHTVYTHTWLRQAWLTLIKMRRKRLSLLVQPHRRLLHSGQVHTHTHTNYSILCV